VQQSGGQHTTRQLLWAVIIGSLIATFLIIVICGYLFEWKWTGLVKDASFDKRTLWDWMRLLIIPAAIAGGTIWFNQSQRARDEQRARHDEIVKALQEDKKESVAYFALQAREEGLPEDKERRAQLLVALYLAMLFQHSDRSRALLVSALRDSYHTKHRNEVVETLQRLIEDFESYKKELDEEQKELPEKVFHIDISEYVSKLKVLKRALLAQKDSDST